jgi:hypothetical protein
MSGISWRRSSLAIHSMRGFLRLTYGIFDCHQIVFTQDIGYLSTSIVRHSRTEWILKAGRNVAGAQTRVAVRTRD